MKKLKFGFTIVETMLFLAITGVLIAGILVGTSASINVQRYHDSIRSLQTKIKKVYSDVISVNNSGENLECTNNESVVALRDGGKSALGKSDCVLMGQYINSTDGTKLSYSDVIAFSNDDESTILSTPTDIEAFELYSFIVSPNVNEYYSLEWGASVSAVSSENDLSNNFSILILRSPTSGIVRTFVKAGEVDGNIKNLIIEDNIQDIKLCVDSNGLFTGNKMAINIKANANGADGVVMLGDNSECPS